MPYYVAFDNSHKERAKLDENFTELRDYLNENDFVCYNFLETPVTQESLRPFDILVIACPDFSKFSHIEIMEIANWVKEDGGGLLLLSHAGGDRGRNSNLSELSEQFGIAFENDQVLDEVNNIGIENMPIISSINFIPPHPITNSLTSICYRAGCSLTVIGSAISIGTSNETSEPFSCPIICTSEPNRGRVCTIGSYEMFRDKTGGGFQYDDHPVLTLNIFNWLISDYRMELTTQGEQHTLPVSIKPANTIEKQSSTEDAAPQVETPMMLDSLITFSSKAEVIEILHKYLTQINTMKTNIHKLIEIISESAEEIFCEPEDQEIEAGSPTNPDFIYEPYQEEESVYDYLSSRDPSNLTALPPKPPGLEKKEDETDEEEFINPVPIAPSKKRKPPKPSKGKTKTKKKSKPKPKEKKKVAPKIEKKEESKEELGAKLDNLESKLNSVINLLKFIEKKHDDGKLDDKTFEKQTQKLQKDLDQTKKRISEIKSQIE